MPGSSVIGSDSTKKTNKFKIYEKTSGRYLGQAELAESLPAEEIRADNLQFVLQLTESGLKREEYMEEDQEEPKYINLLPGGDLKKEEHIKVEEVEVEEDVGMLSLPTWKFPSEATAGTSDSGSAAESGDMSGKAGDEKKSRKRTKVRCLLCRTVTSSGDNHRHIRSRNIDRAN